MENIPQSVVVLQSDKFNELCETVNQLQKEVRQAIAKEPPKYLSSSEFMEKAKIGRWKFDQLKANGTIKVIQKGRKYYIPMESYIEYFKTPDL